MTKKDTKNEKRPIERDMTVGRLKDLLSQYPDDCTLLFSDGRLRFYRLKLRGDKLVLEFDQNVFWDDDARLWRVHE